MNYQGWTYRQEYVKCGKANCSSCPHGPYWYAYKAEGGRLKKKYVGKSLPEGFEGKQRGQRPHDHRDAIFNPATRTVKLAWEILGMADGTPYKQARRQFLALVMQHHPDRGGDTHEMALISAAWDWIKTFYRWELKG